MSENQSFRNDRRKKKNNKKKKIIISSVLGVLALFILWGIWYYNHISNQIHIESENTKTREVNYEEVEGITNILLIGTDGRDEDEAARADSIIIATLDNNSKKVKLTSILRDTLVNIPEYGEDKINSAFFYGSIEKNDNGELRGFEGGASLLMDTIEENFHIDLDKYVIVNFWGFEEIIDEIGGIEADIKDYEIDEINKYIGESTGVKSPPITETGLQTLNGQQALAYARIRYVGNGGFERSERQSKVLFQVATKLKEVNPIRYVSLANTLAKQVKTNISIPDALDLAYTIYKLPSLDFEQIQIPQTELIARDNLYKDRGWCLLIDIEQNAKIMNDFIFEDKVPNSEEFDLQSVYNVAAAYDAEEARYNSLYNINPSDYYSEDGEDITPTPPKVERPEYNQQEEPSNNTNSNSGNNSSNTNGNTNNNSGNNSSNTNENTNSNAGNNSSNTNENTNNNSNNSGTGNNAGSGNTDNSGTDKKPSEGAEGNNTTESNTNNGTEGNTNTSQEKPLSEEAKPNSTN